jgi:hypothetical protein
VRWRDPDLRMIDVRPTHTLVHDGWIPGAIHLDLFGISPTNTAPEPLQAFMWTMEHLVDARGVNLDTLEEVALDGWALVQWLRNRRHGWSGKPSPWAAGQPSGAAPAAARSISALSPRSLRRPGCGTMSAQGCRPAS